MDTQRLEWTHAGVKVGRKIWCPFIKSVSEVQTVIEIRTHLRREQCESTLTKIQKKGVVSQQASPVLDKVLILDPK